MRGIGITARVTDWEDSQQIAQINSLDIDITRYPGGKNSSDFNWITGTSWGHKPHHVAFPVTELAEWMRKCSIPRVMLVVSVFQDVNTVIAYLQLARESGVPVDYITLGNEIYGKETSFKGEVMNWSGWKYKQKCKKLIPLILEEFPEAKIYGCAIGKRGNGWRQQFWNASVVGLDSLLDGWDTHIYVTAGWDVTKRLQKYEANKIESDKEILIGEYGSKNIGNHQEVIDLRTKIEEFADIAINYNVVNHRADIHGKIDKKDNTFTPEGQLWRNNELGGR